MYCTECGAKNSDTAKFCRNCGRRLAESVPPADAGPDTVVLENVSQEMGQEETQQSYMGGQPYGNQQPYMEGQPYGNQQPYMGGQPYGDQQSYVAGQPYGNGQSYRTEQPYGNQYPYGAGQQGYAQNPYGNQQVYGPANGKKQKKKGKKGVVVAIVLILLAAVIGGGVFLYIKESDPMAAVNRMMDGMSDGDWEKVYDSIYWGDSDSSDWVSMDEFVKEAESGLSGQLSMLGALDNLKFEKISEGDPYEGDDGLTRKRLTVKMTVDFMGMSQSEETDLVVVKTGKKFLFIPVWKMDNEGMNSLF